MSMSKDRRDILEERDAEINIPIVPDQGSYEHSTRREIYATQEYVEYYAEREDIGQEQAKEEICEYYGADDIFVPSSSAEEVENQYSGQ